MAAGESTAAASTSDRYSPMLFLCRGVRFVSIVIVFSHCPPKLHYCRSSGRTDHDSKSTICNSEERPHALWQEQKTTDSTGNERTYIFRPTTN